MNNIHCRGTYYKVELICNSKEEAAIKQLSAELELNPQQVLRQALRQYQLVHNGNATLIFKDSDLKRMNDE